MPAPANRADRVITGALIDISVTSKDRNTNFSIGRAMALNIQESYRIVPVFGIGNMTAQELPILQYAGGFSVQQFAVSGKAVENVMNQFKKMGATGVSDVAAFTRQLLYTDGIDVTVYRREKSTTSDTGFDNIAIAKITGAVCTSETMGIQENQILVRNGEFIFADPVSVSNG